MFLGSVRELAGERGGGKEVHGIFLGEWRIGLLLGGLVLRFLL